MVKKMRKEWKFPDMVNYNNLILRSKFIREKRNVKILENKNSVK